MNRELPLDIRIEGGSDEASISRLVDKILQAGINARASDIHLDPRKPQMCLRFRIDGAMYDIATVSKSIEAPLVTRIKSLADMDIAERRRPQDGHVCVRFNERDYDLNIGSAFTISGEKVLVRIRDKNKRLLDVDELGLSAKNKGAFLSLIIKSSGMVLVTGPADSGKTTTLYAALNRINNFGKNVATIEDFVEYKLKGINQTQLNPVTDINFATGLRAILKQDPDIIMVGEIKDLETATIALNAALNGHLVFSTMHVNDAACAITRLIDMGLEPFLVSSALMGVVTQRLVRTICPECKKQYEPSADTLKELGIRDHKSKRKFYRGGGCPYCMYTAYYGRMGVFEVMRICDKIRELILRKQPAGKIREAAVKKGMLTLKEAVLEKLALGIIPPEEIKRTIFSAEG